MEKAYIKKRGNPIETIKKGDVIKCPPEIKHWHDATPHHQMIHIAIGTNTQKGSVIWLAPVTEREYRQ